jgi:hypothetical protein
MAAHHSVSNTALDFSSTERSHYVRMVEQLRSWGGGGSFTWNVAFCWAPLLSAIMGFPVSSSPDILIRFWLFPWIHPGNGGVLSSVSPYPVLPNSLLTNSSIWREIILPDENTVKQIKTKTYVGLNDFSVTTKQVYSAAIPGSNQGCSTDWPGWSVSYLSSVPLAKCRGVPQNMPRQFLFTFF